MREIRRGRKERKLRHRDGLDYTNRKKKRKEILPIERETYHATEKEAHHTTKRTARASPYPKAPVAPAVEEEDLHDKEFGESLDEHERELEHDELGQAEEGLVKPKRHRNGKGKGKGKEERNNKYINSDGLFPQDEESSFEGEAAEEDDDEGGSDTKLQPHYAPDQHERGHHHHPRTPRSDTQAERLSPQEAAAAAAARATGEILHRPSQGNAQTSSEDQQIARRAAEDQTPSPPLTGSSNWHPNQREFSPSRVYAPVLRPVAQGRAGEGGGSSSVSSLHDPPPPSTAGVRSRDSWEDWRSDTTVADPAARRDARRQNRVLEHGGGNDTLGGRERGLEREDGGSSDEGGASGEGESMSNGRRSRGSVASGRSVGSGSFVSDTFEEIARARAGDDDSEGSSEDEGDEEEEEVDGQSSIAESTRGHVGRSQR